MALSFSTYASRQLKAPTGVMRLRTNMARGLHHLTWGIIFVCLFLTAPPVLEVSLADNSPQITQEELKAVYLYNFLQFVTWPKNEEKTKQTSSKLICLINDSAVNNALEGLRSSLSTTKTAPFLSKYYEEYSEGMDISACDILFVSTSEKNHFKELILGLKDAPILTVSDSDTFGALGGMIFFTEDQNRLRYHINRKATTASGLRLNSQLLKSALEVTDN
ncbi:MAG: YfiR family protein [Desulfobulbaceae bacterium]|nr:YfiR family protein [Desulfobulbaceae bacterium]